MGKKNPSRRIPGPYSKRKINVKDTIQRFLIVCEGARTEPIYFKSFRVPKEVISVDIHGTGYNTISLVQRAIELRNDEDYDQVWCVFDRDIFPPQNFNAAI